jgi:hypothetical protein
MKTDAHWLNRERLVLYPSLILVLFLLLGLLWVLMSLKMVDTNGSVFCNDFITFWSASYLALAGHAQDAYNTSLLFKVQQITAPASKTIFIWFYPPPFFLVVLPLALLPYIAAYWSFILSTLSIYLLVLRRIVRGKTAMLCIVSFSGLWVNLLSGQNAFLTAALCGAALLTLERRPVLAGLFIGLLAIKPHLALLFPVALIAIGAWRSLVTAALTAVTFTALGTITLGPAVLTGFIEKLGSARLFMENESIIWRKMPSVFAFMRLLGIPVLWAYFAHFLVAVVAVVVVWFVWRRCQDWNLRGAVLMTATFLVSPYVFDYDLAWLAFPVAWLGLDGLRNGWFRGEREVLVVAWLLPMLLVLQKITALSVQVGPLVLCCLLWMAYRRATSVSMLGVPATGCCSDRFEALHETALQSCRKRESKP